MSRSVQSPRPPADRHVDVVGSQIDQVDQRLQAQADARLAGDEGHQPGRQPARGEIGRHADGNTRRTGLAEPGDLAVKLAERRLGGLQKLLALLGQRDAAMASREDRETEFTLQPVDLVADGALGQVQVTRRRRKAEMAGHRVEQTQAVIGLEAHLFRLKNSNPAGKSFGLRRSTSDHTMARRGRPYKNFDHQNPQCPTPRSRSRNPLPDRDAAAAAPPVSRAARSV